MLTARQEALEIYEQRTFGPPGTGKTWWLARQVERAADKYGKENVIVASYTRTAATEIISRVEGMPRDNAGTLHALCYRALGSPEIAETHAEEFNQEHPGFAISGDVKGVDEMAVDIQYASDGDKFLADYRLNRARMVPFEQMEKKTQAFAMAWEKWKGKNGYIDFTDMVAYTLQEQKGPPEGQEIGFYDEAQDFNRLELSLVRMWAQHQRYVILAGDDDQCSTEGTLVQTTTGQVPVEQLDPNIHKLVSYDRDHAEFKGVRNGGYSFQIAKRFYQGSVFQVSATGYHTTTTPDHIWEVKWTREAESKIAVYLMKKGDLYRIGRAKLIRADGCLNLGVRARREGADALWIVKLCDSTREASLWESLISIKFGIPTVLFNELEEKILKRSFYDKETLELFWKLAKENIPLQKNAEDLIDAIKRPYPFWEKENNNRFGATFFDVRACNLFSDIMRVPIYTGRRDPFWSKISVYEKQYSGFVYSLNVERFHRYIADGIVTHNCLYGFSGASADAFLDPPIPKERKLVLSKSWRVPACVHAHASKWIEQLTRREPKHYEPRDAEGELRRFDRGSCRAPQFIIEDAMRYVERGSSVMFLTSCGYMLNQIKTTLREDGIPFHNPYRKNRGDWNPLGAGGRGRVSSKDRLLAFLEKDTMNHWSWEQLEKWIDIVKVKDVLHKGGKGAIDDMIEFPTAYTYEEIRDFYQKIFKEEALAAALARDLGWLKKNLLKSKETALGFPIRVLEKSGLEALNEKPKIIISTIHGVKGGEADYVYLFPDVSLAAITEWQKGGEARDAMIRMFYVGMTRAREGLILCQPSSRLQVTIG